MRLDKTVPELEEQELAWWEKYAELEEKFCWVQGETERSIIRKSYINKILSKVNENDKVLDLGCGNGWLLVELAKKGRKNLKGVDFSNAQITSANALAKKMKVEQNVRFFVNTDLNFDDTEKYDVIIFHGFCIIWLKRK